MLNWWRVARHVSWEFREGRPESRSIGDATGKGRMIWIIWVGRRKLGTDKMREKDQVVKTDGPWKRQ